MRRPAALALGAVVLTAGWGAALAGGSFAAHMAAHVAVVAVASPLLVLGTGWRPRMLRLPMAALAACGVELVVVWAWHAPWLHMAAREYPGVFVVEQVSFLLAGYAVWASALSSASLDPDGARSSLAGVGALLMTSMHMTLLGGLLAVSSRPWYQEPSVAGALPDQQIGGVIMLAVGGLSYLTGALVLLGRSLIDDSEWKGAP